MSGLIVVINNVPGAPEVREMLMAYGFEAELRGYFEAILFGTPKAIVLALDHNELLADERVEGLRGMGYEGLLFVLGRIAPDLDIRQRLAENRAWFLPALSGPGDIVARVRQLL